MRWARSKDRWRRRLALVATVPLNSRARGRSGDTARTLKMCAALIDDRDDMVVTALRPFTGRPEEAFRHYRGKAAIPACTTRQ